ncbi:MAG TPA: MucB/RseB C-terminal domain-containing protein [Methylophilaceae bacterium]
MNPIKRSALLIAASSLLSVLSLSAADAATPQNPWEMLEKAGLAAHQLSYRGVFVYQSGNQMNAMNITHINHSPQGEFTRVIVLDGAPREMLQQGNEAVIYQPKSEKVMIEKRHIQSGFPALLPKMTEDIKANYQVQLGGVERVGGREANVLTLTPRDTYRYANKLWIDRDSGLLLKLAVYNEKNEMIEQVGFNQLLLIDTGDMQWFRPSVDDSKTYEIQPEETVTPVVEAGGWVIGQLPKGFRKTEQVLRQVPGSASSMMQLVFFDGMASISLFIESLDKKIPPKQGIMTQGSTNLCAMVVADHQIVVMGEVPAATVMQIAHSVSKKP